MIRTTLRVERWATRRPFRITGWEWSEIDVLVAELRDGDCVGRGEACGVYYKGETPATIQAEIETLLAETGPALDRALLQHLLPPGGARNALDCALWELDAQRAGKPVWALAGMQKPRPLLTTFTVGADDPGAMAAVARDFAEARALKLKLVGDGGDAERVRAVRAARPDVWLGVDGNQGFTPATLDAVLPALVETRVALLEQPFAVGQDAPLADMKLPMPVAADESVQDRRDLAQAAERYDVVNIKLDKSGGLTEALAMAEEAARLDLQLMVGNMLATSWSMAPSYLVGQLCEIVDLDGPPLLTSDRTPGCAYVDGQIVCSDAVWGGARSHAEA